MLTFNEAALVVDALNGIRRATGIAKSDYLQHNVLDAIQIDSLDAKWSVNASEFRDKLCAFSEAQAGDLLKRVERFWDASPHVDLHYGLSAAGLIKGDG